MEQSNNTKWWAIGIIVVFVCVGLWGYKQPNQQLIETVYLSSGIETGIMLKRYSTNYYAEYGKFPSSNKEVGLAEPDVYANQALQTAEITTNGVIKLTYDGKTGVEGGVVQFVPTAVVGMIKWRCETPDYQNIGKYMPQCEYIATPNSKELVTEQIKNILPIKKTPPPEPVITENVLQNHANEQCDDNNKPMLLDGVFTRHIVDAAPIDYLQSLGTRQQELYFYSTIIGGEDQKVSHRWLFNNQPVQEETFILGSDQFPIWSKQLLTHKQGQWEVQVWAQGCLLDRFSITQSDQDEAQTIGIDKRYDWHQPKDVLDTLIIDSAQALIVDQDYNVESWMLKDNQWNEEYKSSDIYSDDITAYIRAGDLTTFKNALWKFNANRRNSIGDTPLIEAIKAGQQEIALYLLNYGANPFIRGVDGSRPYKLAVANEMETLRLAILHYAETEKLWFQGKDGPHTPSLIQEIMLYQKWQHRNALGDTPLLLAARKDNDWAVAVLLQENVNPFINDNLGKRANELARDNDNLFAAALIEHAQQLRRAPWQIIESAISTGMKGNRPLDCVEQEPLAKSITYYYVNRLMDTKTDLLRHKWFYNNQLVKEVTPNKGGNKNTLFSSHTLTEIDKGYWVVELVNEHDKVLDRMKITYGEKYTGGGNTPLSEHCLGPKKALHSLIAGWQSATLIMDLIDEIGNFDPNNPVGLSDAIESGNISVVRLLIDHGVDISTVVLHGRRDPTSPLFLAVKKSNATMVKYLLYRGADANQPGHGKTTTLVQAVVDQKHKMVKLLLDNGADPTTISKYDSLPLINAANTCDIEIMTSLVKQGARFDQKTKKGLTALDMASRSCRSSVNWQAIRQLTEQESN